MKTIQKEKRENKRDMRLSWLKRTIHVYSENGKNVPELRLKQIQIQIVGAFYGINCRVAHTVKKQLKTVTYIYM